MRTIQINDLKPGMIAGNSAFSKHGQLLVEENSILSVQMISHLRYYGIESLKIHDSELPIKAIQNLAEFKNADDSYSKRIVNSKEFAYFKEDYTEKISLLKDTLNDFVYRNSKLETDALLEETKKFFSKSPTTISMFDMLHNLRQIDDSTYAHSMNVALIARMIGMWMNYDENTLDLLMLCGLLHDVGKSQIPAEIIGKPGRLSQQEFEIVKMHPKIGYDILLPSDVNIHVKNSALMHHERFDGKGYPNHLKAGEIDDFASIISIADVYDAMTSNRCYRVGMCPFEVIAVFEQEGLNRYNPKYILTFIDRIANTYANNDVMLSNGIKGRIILIPKGHPTRPTVQVGKREFINLQERLDLYIQAII